MIEWRLNSIKIWIRKWGFYMLFFAAVLIGFVLFAQYLGHTSKESVVNDKIKAESDMRRAFWDQISMTKQEHCDFMSYEFSYHMSRAIEFIRRVPGLEYAKFKTSSKKDQMAELSNMVYFLSAVMDGKVTSGATHSIPRLDDAIDLHVKKEQMVEFCKMIEEELASHGIENARLWAAPGTYRYFYWEVSKFMGEYYDYGLKVKRRCIRVTDPILIDFMTGISSWRCDELNEPIIEKNKKDKQLLEELQAELDKHKEIVEKEIARLDEEIAAGRGDVIVDDFKLGEAN